MYCTENVGFYQKNLMHKMLYKVILQLKKTEDLLKKHKNKAKFTINSKKY